MTAMCACVTSRGSSWVPQEICGREVTTRSRLELQLGALPTLPSRSLQCYIPVYSFISVTWLIVKNLISKKHNRSTCRWTTTNAGSDDDGRRGKPSRRRGRTVGHIPKWTLKIWGQSGCWAPLPGGPIFFLSKNQISYLGGEYGWWLITQDVPY